MATAVTPVDKGLKTGALGFVSSVVIGVASTAPGYSLAVVARPRRRRRRPRLAGRHVGRRSSRCCSSRPSYYYLNRADPDCGTTFSWVTRAIGPVTGWIGGWAIIDRGRHRDGEPRPDRRAATRFLLVRRRTAWRTARAGCRSSASLWIAVMTWICYVGIEVSAKTQWFLLGAEVVDPRDLRGRRAREGLHPDIPIGSDPPVALVAQPVRHLVDERADLAASSSRSSSTGAGTASSR